tara:strand:- start:46 stop:531 length:486 start_codon:yes stop_codon:yes gene_type:complete
MNNQGKRPEQYEDSTRFAWYGVLGMVIVLILVMMLSSCMGTYYISDSEYSDLREEHASLTYHNNSIYWGWNSGYYYYYGKPHYYPWYYYYGVCPPSHYHTTTHVVITKPVKKPTHRPNRSVYRPRSNNKNTKITVKPHRNVKSNTNRKKVNKKVIIRKGPH